MGVEWTAAPYVLPYVRAVESMSVSARIIAGKIEAIAFVFTCVFELAMKIEAFIAAMAVILASISGRAS